MAKTDKKLTTPLTCGHCGNKAPMQLIYTHSQVKTTFFDDCDFSYVGGYSWDLLECQTCSGVLLRRLVYHGDDAIPDEVKIV